MVRAWLCGGVLVFIGLVVVLFLAWPSDPAEETPLVHLENNHPSTLSVPGKKAQSVKVGKEGDRPQSTLWSQSHRQPILSASNGPLDFPEEKVPPADPFQPPKGLEKMPAPAAPEPPSKGKPAELPLVADAKTAELLEGLQAPLKANRLAALVALGKRGTASKAAVPAVRELLYAQDRDIGNQAARTLAQIGRTSVVPLAEVLKADNAIVRLRAAWSLSLFGPQAKDAVEALGAALDDPNPEVRGQAALALGEIGPAAQPACRQLIKALWDHNAHRSGRQAALGGSAVWVRSRPSRWPKHWPISSSPFAWERLKLSHYWAPRQRRPSRN